MTQLLYGSLNRSFENHAPGKLFLFPYPSVSMGATTAAYLAAILALLYGTDTTYTKPSTSSGGTASFAGNIMTVVGAPTSGSVVQGSVVSAAGVPAGVTIQSGAGPYTLSQSVGTIAVTPFSTALQPWGDIDEGGCQFKVATESLSFPHNDGSVPSEIVSGIKSADLSLQIYDADANHWADIFGVSAADIAATVASPTASGNIATLLATPNSSQKWIAILQMASATPGYSDFLILFRTSFVGDPDVKYSQKDKIAMKVKLAANPDLYLQNAQGVPAFGMIVTCVAPHT